MKVFLFAIFTVFLFPSILTWGDISNETNSTLYKGLEYLQDNKFEEAIYFFDQVLEVDPNHVDALAKKSDALLSLGQFKQAAISLDKLFSVSPYYKDDSGKFYLDKLIEIQPNHVEALYKRGKSLAIFTDQLDNAISYFDKALKIEPNRVDIITSKAEIFIVQEKFEDAILLFDNVLDSEPDYWRALSGKGNALSQLGRFEEAHSYIDRALEIEPNDPDILFSKADALREQKKYDQAFTYFHKVLEIQPDNFLAQNKFKIVYNLLNFTKQDGNIEITIHNSQGYIISHLKINKFTVLDHELFENMVNQWNVTKIINRNGTDYEVRQYETVKDEFFRTFHGGVSSYGLKLHKEDLVRSDYWFYEVDAGDTIRSVFNIFTPVT